MAPNTRLIVTIELLDPGHLAESSSLGTARAVNLEGLADLAGNVEDHLFGEAKEELFVVQGPEVGTVCQGYPSEEAAANL
jgi:hypothetical protein